MFWLLLIIAVLAPSDARAEDVEISRPDSINVHPLPLLIESIIVTYEHIFPGGHGLIIEPYGNFGVHTPESETRSQWWAGAAVGYRWHWSETQTSGFLGVHAGGGYGGGRAAGAASDPERRTETAIHWFVVPNIGGRIALSSSLNLTIRGGVGYADYDFVEVPDEEGTEGIPTSILLRGEHGEGFSRSSRDNSAVIDFELSAGWNF